MTTLPVLPSVVPKLFHALLLYGLAKTERPYASRLPVVALLEISFAASSPMPGAGGGGGGGRAGSSASDSCSLPLRLMPRPFHALSLTPFSSHAMPAKKHSRCVRGRDRTVYFSVLPIV